MADDAELSEFYLPVFERIVGVGYVRCEAARKKDQDGGVHDHLVDAFQRWWNSVEAFGMMIGHLAVDKGELTYLILAVGNHKRVLADYAKEHLGFDPIMDIDTHGKATDERLPKGWYTPEYVYAWDPRGVRP